MSRTKTPGSSTGPKPRSAAGNGVSPSTDPQMSRSASGHDEGTTQIARRNATETGASAGVAALRDSLPASADAIATGGFQDVLGNGMVLDAISGQDSGGFGGVVAGEVTAAMGGVHARGFESNHAMAQAMRDAISPDAGEALSHLQLGGGHPIPAHHRERMERAFDHDFDHVRLHTDAKAAKAAEAIHAYAFAIGSDIFFGRGTFALGSAQGDRLLAHELTHVVQHDEGRIPTVGSDQDAVSSPSDPLEREAYGNEVRIVNLLQQVDAELRAEATGQGAQDAEQVAQDAAATADQDEQLDAPSLDIVEEAPSLDLVEESVTIDAVEEAPTLDTLEITADSTGMIDSATELGGDDDPMMDGLGMEVAGGFAAAAPPAAPADDGTDGTAMRDESGPASADAPAARDLIKRSRGTRIAPELAARLSGALGYDISHAVLHTDAAAAAAAEALQANAFALGSDVFFAQGAFQPGTDAGDELLLHELTHVAQHDAGRLPSVSAELAVSSPSDSLEREARDAADQASDSLARQSDAVDTDALSWGEPAAPDAVSQHVSAVLGFTDAPLADMGSGSLAELDAVAFDLGAGAFASMSDSAASMALSADSGLALRDADDASSGQTQSSTEGVPMPEDLSFTVVGFEIELDASKYIPQLPTEATIPFDVEPVPGLKLKTGTISFGDDGMPEEGTISAGLKIGAFEVKEGVELTVDEDCNILGDLKGVSLDVVEGFEFIADVTVSKDSLTAEVMTKVTSEVELGSGVKLTGASMSGKYADSTLTMEGSLDMAFGDWVEGTITATFQTTTSEESVDSDLDLKEQGDEETKGGGGSPDGGGAPSGASTDSGSSPDGGSAPGGGDLESKGEAELEAPTEDKESGGEQEGKEDDKEQLQATPPEPVALEMPDGTWTASGTLTQTKELTKGDLTLKNTKLGVSIEEGTLAEVKAEAEVEAPHLKGKASGAFDVKGQTLFGEGSVELTEELRLEELGVTVDGLNSKATVEANKLTRIQGSLSAKVDYEDEPTFAVSGEQLVYEYADEKFSGQGQVSLLRDLTFGDEEATHLKVLKAASAKAEFENSDIKKITGELDFEVNDKEGQLGTGKVTVERESADAPLGGTGSFQLTGDYGLPDRTDGPFIIKEQSKLGVAFKDTAPEKASLEEVTFELKQEGKGATGRIDGSVEGSYTFKDEKITGKANATIGAPWKEEFDGGSFTFKEGGKVDIAVEENDYEDIKLEVPYELDVTEGEHPFKVDGKAKGALSAEDAKYTGDVDGELKTELDFEVGKDAGTIKVLDGAKVSAKVEENELSELGLKATVQYLDKDGELFLEGAIEESSLNLEGKEPAFDAKGKLTLKRDIEESNKEGDLKAVLKSGAELEVQVEDNALERVGGSADFEIHDDKKLFAGGIKEASIELGDETKVSGTVNAKLARTLDFPREAGEGGDEDATGTPFALKVKEGSKVDGTLTDNELDEVGATLDFEVHEGEGGKLAEGGLEGSWKVSDDKFDGSGDLKLTRNYPLKEGKGDGKGRLEGWSIELRKDSLVSADMKQNVLQQAEVDVKVDFKQGETLAAEGNIAGQYTLGQTEGFTGQAGVKLLEKLDWAEDDKFTYQLVPPTEVKAEAKESVLSSAKGTFVVDALEDDEPVINLTAEATYEPGKGITADAEVKVLEDMLIADGKSWDVYLAQDSGGKAKVVEDALTEVGGTLKLRADKDETEMVKGEFEATYKVSDGDQAKVDAKGEAELINDLEVESDNEDYGFFVEKGTKAGAELSDGELTKVDGTVKVRVEDDTPFLKAEAKGTWEKEGDGSKVGVEGKATVTRDKKIVEKGDWKVTLKENSSASVHVEDSELLEVGGNVKVQVDDKAPFATGELDGSWTKDGGTSGKVVGTLLRELNMGTLGEYTFFVVKDAKGSAFMEENKVTKVGGDIDIRIDDAKDTFLEGNVKGEYELEGKGFSGSGKMSVVTQKKLGELKENSLWVLKGGNASVKVKENALEEFGGEVNLSLRDGESEYVQVKFDGTYDVGAESFTGGGNAKVTRNKKLYGEDGGYQFWLKPASGFSAYAEVTKNKLTKVGGEIPFMVKDGEPAPLIEGSASGDYDLKTGMFDAKGEVYLGRDVEYEIGEGKLVFKAGSGGRGEVKQSKLEKLGGELEVDIYDGEGKLLNVKAEGEFDAVKSKIIYVEGSASLLRPMEPLGEGILVINSLSGKARVEDNKLKWAEGEGKFEVPALNDMKGQINARYENNGGEEVYTGKGKLNFTLFNEPDKGREMKGEIDAELMKGGKFKVKGEADYSMSEMISGKVGVEMDEKMDPTINASMTVTEELLPAQDLFQMKMDLIPHTDVPIYGPISLGFGARGSMGLATRPLNFETTIGVSNWKPMSEGNVPDFEADLGLDWGLDFNAMLAAYLTLGLTVGIGSAGAGIRGEVELSAPLDISPYGKLKGSDGKFTGELGVGIKLEPQLTLAAVPFVMAQLKGFDPLEHDFTRFESELGPIFSFEWGTKYTFGDEDKQEDASAASLDSGAPTQSDKEHSKAPEVGTDKIGTPQSAPGGPELESGDKIAGKSGSERASSGSDEMSELMDTIDTVTVLAEGLGALAYLLGLLVDLITALMTMGPAGLIVVLAWKIVTGELTWSRLVDAVEKVVEAVETAAELLRPHLPDWLNNVIDFFSGEKPSLIDAFFGADDKIRAEVHAGTYTDFPNDSTGSDMTAEWIDAMADGYCGGADEACILELLRFAEGRGQLRAVLGKVDGGADHLDYKIDGSNSRQFRAIMDRNGIQYEKSFW